MPDSVTPSVLAFDDEHHLVRYVEGRVVGWTGTRAQYAWHIMLAPAISSEQIVFLEATPITAYDPFPYRGDAVAALRRHAGVHHLRIVECTDGPQQFEARYSEALEQEIHELQARCQHVQLARNTETLINRLTAYETTCAQLHAILSDHFASQQTAWERIQTLLRCCMTDAPDTE